VHLVGFIIRIYHDARSPDCQTQRTSAKINLYLQAAQHCAGYVKAISLQNESVWSHTNSVPAILFILRISLKARYNKKLRASPCAVSDIYVRFKSKFNLVDRVNKNCYKNFHKNISSGAHGQSDEWVGREREAGTCRDRQINDEANCHFSKLICKGV